MTTAATSSATSIRFFLSLHDVCFQALIMAAAAAVVNDMDKGFRNFSTLDREVRHVPMRGR